MLTKSIVQDVSTLRESRLWRNVECSTVRWSKVPARGREFAGGLSLGTLICGTCSFRSVSGMGKPYSLVPSDASWAVAPIH